MGSPCWYLAGLGLFGSSRRLTFKRGSLTSHGSRERRLVGVAGSAVWSKFRIELRGLESLSELIHNRSSTSRFLGAVRSLKVHKASSELPHDEPRCSFRSLSPGKVLPGAPVTPRNSGTPQRSEQTHTHDRLYLQHEYPIQFVYRNSIPPYIYDSTPPPITMSRNPQPPKRSASAAGVLGDITGNERRVRHSSDKGSGVEGAPRKEAE